MQTGGAMPITLILLAIFLPLALWAWPLRRGQADQGGANRPRSGQVGQAIRARRARLAVTLLHRRLPRGPVLHRVMHPPP